MRHTRFASMSFNTGRTSALSGEANTHLKATELRKSGLFEYRSTQTNISSLVKEWSLCQEQSSAHTYPNFDGVSSPTPTSLVCLSALAMSTLSRRYLSNYYRLAIDFFEKSRQLWRETEAELKTYGEMKSALFVLMRPHRRIVTLTNLSNNG